MIKSHFKEGRELFPKVGLGYPSSYSVGLAIEKVGSNAACALKRGTLSCMLHLWTEM